MWRRNVDCLGVAVAIESHVAEADVDAQLTAVFRTYAEASAATSLAYRLVVDEWPTVHRGDGWRKRCDSVLDLVPALELDLYTQITVLAQGLVLHAAAAVGTDGRTLVLAGVSGAGKSTLLRSLLERGYDYLTEECVALSPDGTAIGLARALHVDNDRVAVPADFICDRYTLRTAAGLRETRLFHPPPARIWRHPARTAAIVCLSHDATGNNQLVGLSAGEAIARLWPMILRQVLDDAMTAPLGTVPVYALHTTAPEDALDRVLALGKELGVVPR